MVKFWQTLSWIPKSKVNVKVDHCVFIKIQPTNPKHESFKEARQRDIFKTKIVSLHQETLKQILE